MIPLHNLHISFQELALRGAKVLAKQGPITFEKALEQVNRLKMNSKVQHEKYPERQAVA
jgi:hypothetical protein